MPSTVLAAPLFDSWRLLNGIPNRLRRRRRGPAVSDQIYLYLFASYQISRLSFSLQCDIHDMSVTTTSSNEVIVDDKNGARIDHDVLVSEVDSTSSGSGGKTTVPLKAKLISVLLISLIGFGGHWSSGVTGAMKSTLKKVSRVSLSIRELMLIS